ncbi:sulfatase-like hydrolase/transferase [Haloferax sp. YSMS24]|uniref:sulfatase-like hydrolase/transferase n=1 Tax=Haloferax sp. YSMS24 TaxID=3388425 RepID=UPI00398CFD03
MDVLFITIDSLRRDVLGTYADTPRFANYNIETPNLDRFAQRATVFDTHYAGSLPCMPQRREFLCGIREFPWRPWGNAEPFDSTVPALASEAGAVTQLLTDHYHYLEYDGHGYYEPFDGFEMVRGHEYDSWKTAPREDPRLVAQCGADKKERRLSYPRNTASFDEFDETDFFAPKLFSALSKWLENNHDHDQWFCYTDSFDVHEPFHCPEPYASMYTDEDPRDPELSVWPPYSTVEESGYDERELSFVRSQFAGKVTMVDRWFGRVLDRLDELSIWDDTMVVVTTDHGFSLGDHGWLAKNLGPVYQEIVQTPLFIWHPDNQVDRVDALTSSVDVYSTLLEGLGVEQPDNTHGESLLPLVRGETETHRSHALYGYFGAGINVTDGQYTYLHPNRDGKAANCYSTFQMPKSRGRAAQPDATVGSLPYTDVPVWKYRLDGQTQNEEPLLFDVSADPEQTENLVEEEPEQLERMRDLLITGMQELEVPNEQFQRLGLESER